jgi:hypothetical protein
MEKEQGSECLLKFDPLHGHCRGRGDAAEIAVLEPVAVAFEGDDFGVVLTANAGANLKELMARMGHDSERAALIYLHSTAERQRALADAVGATARAELEKSNRKTATPWHANGTKSPSGG